MSRATQRRMNTQRRKKWGFRLLVLAIVALPWFIAEGVLRGLGWPRHSEVNDVSLGFEGTRPLWSLSDDRQWFEIAPERRFYFQYDRFPANKESDERRIFVVGGSTVQGNPYTIETAFSTWARLALEVGDPRTRWTVVNCGGVSYASYRLVPLVEELLTHDPDVIVLCTGHNEFLERREYRDYLATPRWRRRWGSWARQSALVSWTLDRSMSRPQVATERLSAEVDAVLDHEGGASHYHRDVEFEQAVSEHFAASLARIGTMCRRANVPVVLVLPVSDERDTPPFKSETQFDRTAAAEFEAAIRSPTWLTRSARVRLAMLEQWRQGADDHAGIHYHLGLAWDSLGEAERARTAYRRAIDLDVCPLRCPSPLLDELRQAATCYEWSVVDMPALLASETMDGTIDRSVVIDHVHPTIASHQRVGRELAMVVARLLDRPAAAEDEAVSETYREWLEALPVAYFEHGAERLRLFELWARGMVVRGKPPLGSVGGGETPGAPR